MIGGVVRVAVWTVLAVSVGLVLATVTFLLWVAWEAAKWRDR